jgi:hypothetical protein
MPDSFVQVAPDSTGKLLHTRQRAVTAGTVQEQYVIVQNEAVAVTRLWVSSLRVPTRALTAGATQPIFTVWNGIGAGGNMVSCRRLSAEIDAITAQLVASGQLRLFRQTAASTGGTAIVPQQQYTADPALNALVVVRADHQGDSVSATTALTGGTLAAAPMWSQTVPRVATLVGFQPVFDYTLLPNDGNLMAQDPLIMRPGEGFQVQLIAGGAIAAGANTITIKAVLAEFTYP